MLVACQMQPRIGESILGQALAGFFQSLLLNVEGMDQLSPPRQKEGVVPIAHGRIHSKGLRV